MEADFLENFKFLENSIRNNEILTAKKLVKSLDKTYEYSKQILYEFFISRKNFDNLVIIFQIELIDDSCLKTLLVPSYSQLLSSILNNLEILDFSVYSNFKKDKDFELQDLSVYFDENDIQINFVNKGTSFDLTISSSTSITDTQNGGKEVKPKLIKEVSSENKINPSINTHNESECIIKPHTKTKEKITNSNLSKKQQDKITFPTKAKQQDSMNKSSILKTITSYEEVGSNSISKEKILSSFENNFNIKDENQIEEEEYFYDGKIEANLIEDSFAIVKRKASPGLEDQYDKRKKEDLKTKNETIFGEPDKLYNPQNEKQKIKKFRKVKKTNYAKDENGYLHSIDEYVDEEYWSDEIKQAPKKVSQVDDKKTKNKKAISGQGNILNFFKK